MLLMAGRTALFRGEILMPTGQRAWIDGAKRGRPVAGEREGADERDDQCRGQKGQTSPIAAQGDDRLTRRVLMTTGAIGLRAFLARSAAARRTPTRPPAIVEERPAFGHTATGALARRAAAARLAPQPYPAAPVREVRAFVRASVMLKSIRIGNHSAYTFTKRKCQIESRITAIDKGTCTSNHFFMRSWQA